MACGCTGKNCRLKAEDPRHGQNGYTNLGCRCQVCREENRINHADYMDRHPEQIKKHRDYHRKLRGMPPSSSTDPLHGTPEGWRAHRRGYRSAAGKWDKTPCTACEYAHTIEKAAKRKSKLHPREPLPCGTWGAYRRHLRGDGKGNVTCRVCLDFVNAVTEESRRHGTRGVRDTQFDRDLAWVVDQVLRQRALGLWEDHR